ncbi:MAG: hypothetical protein PHP06_06500 [Clostridia bacterium]|nr:hypothetical protein [Clostridia bacterium]
MINKTSRTVISKDNLPKDSKTDKIEFDEESVDCQCIGSCPTQTVDCCCETQDINFDACQDTEDFTIGGDNGIELKCQARFLKIRIKFRNVCKGRKLAIGVIVCEFEGGVLRPRGFKGVVVNVPDDGKKPKCCNVRVDQFCFVLPEEDSICCPRTIRVKVIAHYADLEPSQFCPC